MTILYCTDLLAVTFELFKFIPGALWAEARDWKELIVAVGISSQVIFIDKFVGVVEGDPFVGSERPLSD